MRDAHNKVNTAKKRRLHTHICRQGSTAVCQDVDKWTPFGSVFLLLTHFALTYTFVYKYSAHRLEKVTSKAPNLYLQVCAPYGIKGANLLCLVPLVFNCKFSSQHLQRIGISSFHWSFQAIKSEMISIGCTKQLYWLMCFILIKTALHGGFWSHEP